jgi:hypothetical protein
MAQRLLAEERKSRFPLTHGTGKPQPAVARQILSYFLRNPEAVDSLEGIARWRLLEQTIYNSVAETDRGLKWLVQHDYLTEVAVRGTEHVFQLNPDKHEEAKLFLKASPQSGTRKRTRRSK